MSVASCRNHGKTQKNTEREILPQDARDGDYSKYGRLVLNSSKSIYLACLVGRQEEIEISELEVRQIPDY